MKRSAQSKGAGFTLVELMIAMVLGLLVVLGGQQGYLALSGINQQIEGHRAQTEALLFASATLRERVQTAGFGIGGQAITGTATEVTVFYARDEADAATAPLVDCLGRPVTSATGVVADRFYVEQDALFCESSVAGVATAERLSAGIAQLAISYRYPDAGGLVAFHADPPADAIQWTGVSAVRATISIRADRLPDRALNTTVALRNPGS